MTFLCAGYGVTALVRTEEGAARLTEQGARTTVLGSMTDTEKYKEAASKCDVLINAVRRRCSFP